MGRAEKPITRRRLGGARVAAVALWLTAIGSLLAFVGILPIPTSDLILPVAAVPGFASVGVILAWHRPDNRVGWLMLGMGSLPAVGQLLGAGDEFRNGVVLVCLALVLVVFPDGTVPSALWRVPIGLLVGGWATSIVLPGLTWQASPGFDVPSGVVVALVGVVWCAAAPFVRYRRAGGIERSQLRWLGSVAAMTGAFGVVALAIVPLPVPAALGEIAGAMALLGAALGVPASILVAITRYRLYDIDRIVSRTVTYAVVIGLLVTVYVSATLLLTEVVPLDSNLAVAAATLAVAALFTPLRRRVRRRVDRRFNRPRYLAEQELDAFTARLRDATDLDTVEADVIGVIVRTLQPSTVGVWIKTRDRPTALRS